MSRAALVRLRPIALEDVDHVLRWVNDPDVVGNFAAFSGKPFTREEELAYLAKLIANPNEKVFSVERTDGTYVGQVGLHQIHWPSKVARLAVIVAHKDVMGRGYGTGAIAHVLDKAFRDLGLHKVWLMVFKTNERSRKIYGRMGFVEEGTLREEYLHRGQWHDMIRMSLLDREWADLRRNFFGDAVSNQA
jgi:RimJ/RimL family protein N-acetyltransferase